MDLIGLKHPALSLRLRQRHEKKKKQRREETVFTSRIFSVFQQMKVMFTVQLLPAAVSIKERSAYDDDIESVQVWD